MRMLCRTARCAALGGSALLRWRAHTRFATASGTAAYGATRWLHTDAGSSVLSSSQHDRAAEISRCEDAVVPAASPTALSLPQLTLVLVSHADSFAQSRIKNYVHRVQGAAASAASGNTAAVSSITGFGVVDVTPRQLSAEEAGRYTAPVNLSKAWVASFDLPVDAFVDGSLTRRPICVTGLAMGPKMAVIAACMHAERCLDALRIPLFTSERRQLQHAQQAEAEGRTAAAITDLPREFAQVELPAPVCLPAGASSNAAHSRPSYQPNPKSFLAGKSGASASGSASLATPSTDSVSPQHLTRKQQVEMARRRRLPRRRSENYCTRYSGDVFMRTTLAELAVLQATIFNHNRLAADGDGDDDGDGLEMASMHITSQEESVLRPELLMGENAAAAAAGNAAGTARRPGSPVGHVVMRQPFLHRQHLKHRNLIDETEGGVYDLVDGIQRDWVVVPEVPGSLCIFDPYAEKRVDGYVRREFGHAFADAVVISFSDEDTMCAVTDKQRLKAKLMRWYTATMELKHLGVCATGKATRQDVAQTLCAMHAESLLQWFGVPLYASSHAQALYYDACLRWGRRVAAVPVDPSTVNAQTASLPKPMKEWFRPSKVRARRSEMNVSEKLLLLNRVVVHNFRKHFLECDLFATDRYSEIFTLSEACLRSFMVAMHHPFEAAYFTLIYHTDAQFRTTIYLPLPERFGVRGGFSIATTPRNSVSLCALNAIDVLCSLDAIPAACMVQPRWQRMLELRESLGLLLPPSYLYRMRLQRCTTDAARDALGPPPPLPDPMLRSPPAYRETPGLTQTIAPSEEVWRMLLIDAEVYDVVPALQLLIEVYRAQLIGGDLMSLPAIFFTEAAAHLFGWSAEQQEYRRYMFHYTGAQRFQSMIKPVANNFWLALPLEEATYGRRVAVGRCLHRNGAERMLCIHALRILRTLKLAPWDSWEPAKLTLHLYKGSGPKTELRMQQWRFLCKYVLDGRDGEGEDGADIAHQTTPEAEITSETVTAAAGSPSAAATEGLAEAANMVHILSPHPVMSREAAGTVF